MVIWSAEIKELEKIYRLIRDKLPDVAQELERLVRTDDKNIALVYARRCLEVIITDLCETELKRPRKTEPLQGIIDKLHKEDKVPSNIIASMHSLNSLATFGSHPRDFDPEQVKPVLINLVIIIKWYIKFRDGLAFSGTEIMKGNPESGENPEKVRIPELGYADNKPAKFINTIMLSGVGITAILLILTLLAFPGILPAEKKGISKGPDGKISIAVIPFENLTGDSLLNWFQRGISSLIINCLGNSSELAVYDDQAMYDVMESMDQVFTASILPAKAREVAKKAGAEIYVSGNIHGMNGLYWILTNLFDTRSGEIIWTHRVEGNLRSSDYLQIVDSLCDEIKNYLETRALTRKTDYDFHDVYPNSVEAYRYFIEGMNMILSSEYPSAIKSLTKAVEIDSTFTFASFYIAYAYNFSNLDPGYRNSMKWTQFAYARKDRLPPKYQNWVTLWYACLISENPEDILRNCRLLEESGIESRLLWLDLGVTYNEALFQFDKAIEAFRKVEEISRQRESLWTYDRFYNDYCDALLLAEKPYEAIRISDLGLRINPDNRICLLYKGSCYVMLGDTASVSRIISEIRSVHKRLHLSQASEEWALGYMYIHGKDTVGAEKHLRNAFLLDPENPVRIRDLARLLVRSGINIEEGFELACKGLSRFPDNISLMWVKGVALNKLGRHHEALEILEEVDSKYSGYLRLLRNDINEAKKGDNHWDLTREDGVMQEAASLQGAER